jgi:hypothetical protein
MATYLEKKKKQHMYAYNTEFLKAYRGTRFIEAYDLHNI